MLTLNLKLLHHKSPRHQFSSPKSPPFPHLVRLYVVKKMTFHGFLAKLPMKIDIWPGRRSGSMIVITSILSVSVFLLLAGLLASVFSALV